jgi:hypothetical protein
LLPTDFLKDFSSTSFGEKASLAFSDLLVTVVCNKNHSFGVCADSLHSLRW